LIREGLLPVGAINFPNADFNIVAQICADLIECKLVQTQRRELLTCAINSQNLTLLSKEECLYALEALFLWQGVGLVPVGDGLAKVVPIPKPEWERFRHCTKEKASPFDGAPTPWREVNGGWL
jgi:hypothetical protein